MPASSHTSASSVRISARTRSVISGEALDVEPHAGALHVAQDADERQLDVVHEALELAIGELLALPLGERGGEHGVARDGVLEGRGQAALLHELAERVAAAGGLEQIGPEQGVVDELRRHLVERLRVVGDDRPVADGAHDVRRAARLAGEHDLVAGRAEAPRAVDAEQLALRDLRRRDGERQLLHRAAR